MASKTSDETPAPAGESSAPAALTPAATPADSGGTTPVPASPVQTVDAAALNDSVEMPVPNERTIAAVNGDAEPARAAKSPVFGKKPAPDNVQDGGEPAAGELDSWKRPYDPAKYFPRKDSLGRWIVRRATAGRGSAAAPAPAGAAPRSIVGEPGQPLPAAGAPGPDKYDLAADLYCRTGYALLDMAFDGGGEWFPENDGEHHALKSATAAYLRFKQSEDLPPGLTLALAVGTYAAPRFVKPRTRARVAGLVGKLRGRLAPLEMEHPAGRAPTVPASPNGAVVLRPAGTNGSET